MLKKLSLVAGEFEKPVSHWGKMFFLSGLVGVLAGFAAALLELALKYGSEKLIGGFVHTAGPHIMMFKWGILFLPAIGGLFSGIIVRLLCSKEHEHGTNQYIASFHERAGSLQLRGPAVKAAASIGVIACGGSAGPEGPIAALGAAIGSAVARVMNLPPRLRRVLLVAGCGGGIGAIFQCPLGGALFAASVLYRDPEFDAESIVPALVASVLSYSTFIAFPNIRGHMLQGADHLRFSSAWELLPYLVLGPVCGLLSIFYSYSFRAVEKLTAKAHQIPSWLAPAVGGLAVGALGCVLPQVMDGQYHFIQNAMDGHLFTEAAAKTWWTWAALFGMVALVKCIATGFTVGSGGAGGLLGPSVFIGGAAGAFVGALFEAAMPGLFPENLRGALIAVGMAGVLSASMRTPMAAIVMVTEMTGSYGLIVPLMLVCVVAYVIGRRWGLNDSQVRSTSESPAHAGDVLIHMLEGLRVRDVMDWVWSYQAQVSSALPDMLSAVPSGARPVFVVLEEQKLVGIVTNSDIARVVSQPGLSSLFIASDVMRTDVVVVQPELSLYRALELCTRTGYNVLPVVTSEGQFLGVLRRDAIHEAVRSRFEDLRSLLHQEHGGLTALHQDAQLYQLVLGVSAPQADTIQRIPVPPDVIGKSLREADFRKNYRAQVIAVQGPDGSFVCPPDVNCPLADGQILLVIQQSKPPESQKAEELASTGESN